MENQDTNNTQPSRREFLKIVGTGAAATTAVSTAALYGCKPDSQSAVNNSQLGEVPVDKMTYRVNPYSGDKVSLLGYGCMRWPLKQKADGSGEEIDQEAVNELVDYAIAHGVNYFDTAPVYIRGWAETATGIALKRHPRDKFFIATKLSNHRSIDPNVSESEAHSFDYAINLYRQSFKSLQVDYIDYYLLHNVGTGGMKTFKERFYENGMVDFLLKEKEAGRIRNLGWSFHGDIGAFDFLVAQDIQWDFAMIQLNYVDWQNASGINTNAQYLYSELVKRKTPVIVMEPLLGGRLSRLPSNSLALLKQTQPEESPASWAFRYAGTPESVLTVLSGMVYMEHLQENIRTYSPLQPINEQGYAVLDNVTKLLLHADYIPCTECQYCMPCPYGLDIPAIFSHYNRCITEGNLPKDSQDKNYRRARHAFLTSFDRGIPKERSFNHCIGCSLCVEKCPQKLPIPENMERIDRLVEQLKQGNLP
ncbi:MAG: aldo/keto reductase [Planctomycetaceae bacterium]|jgi:predicted aldo/keto reductase-like oxidoreductase|nr:aldo/keto reductase [Planctomycetaceae bacterium]